MSSYEAWIDNPCMWCETICQHQTWENIWWITHTQPVSQPHLITRVPSSFLSTVIPMPHSHPPSIWDLPRTCPEVCRPVKLTMLNVHVQIHPVPLLWNPFVLCKVVLLCNTLPRTGKLNSRTHINSAKRYVHVHLTTRNPAILSIQNTPSHHPS